MACALILWASLLSSEMPALAQASDSSEAEIEALKTQLLADLEENKLAGSVERLIAQGRLDAAESALLSIYAYLVDNFPTGPTRSEVVNALGLIFQHGKRTVELELLREGARGHDPKHVQYALT